MAFKVSTCSSQLRYLGQLQQLFKELQEQGVTCLDKESLHGRESLQHNPWGLELPMESPKQNLATSYGQRPRIMRKTDPNWGGRGGREEEEVDRGVDILSAVWDPGLAGVGGWGEINLNSIKSHRILELEDLRENPNLLIPKINRAESGFILRLTLHGAELPREAKSPVTRYKHDGLKELGVRSQVF